ncbi:MAG: hypothetical protein EOO73_20340 [Myxococcales bacterium]|nr:MAG: hypothetical protein EOO73_20340 [Myxococcales bacterium]
MKSELRYLAATLALAASAISTPSAAQEAADEPTPEAAAEATGAPPAATTPAAGTDADAAPQRRTGSAVETPGAPADKPTGSDSEVEATRKGAWETSVSGYFRAPMALGISKRPGPDNLNGTPETQISYGPNRTVDANYYSFGYTRLQEQDWVELFFHAKKKHIQTTVGWMGYWFAGAGFRNPDSAWVPGIAYLTLDTDLDVAGRKPNIALSAGSWWPKFGRFEKYDTYTLGQYRQLGEQLKLTIPVTEDFKATVIQGFGTGRDGSFSILAPPPYQARVGLNLIHYAHLQANYKDVVEVGLHHNAQWTRDPNLLLQTSAGKSYANARGASLNTIGAELKLALPVAGRLWLSPSLVTIKNGWALGEAGVELAHGLSPEGLATNYLGWSGSPADSTGSGKLFNFGFLYENSLANVLGKPKGTTPDVKVSAFGLLVRSSIELPEGSVLPQDTLTHFKWGADAEYNPWQWVGLMLRWDTVNYDMDNGGYVFSAITSRVSFYSHFLSGERIYLQYSRYRYGDNVTLAGRWPWGIPLVAGSDIIQGGPYAGSKPDMDVVRLQGEVSF